MCGRDINANVQSVIFVKLSEIKMASSATWRPSRVQLESIISKTVFKWNSRRVLSEKAAHNTTPLEPNCPTCTHSN